MMHIPDCCGHLIRVGWLQVGRVKQFRSSFELISIIIWSDFFYYINIYYTLLSCKKIFKNIKMNDYLQNVFPAVTFLYPFVAKFKSSTKWIEIIATIISSLAYKVEVRFKYTECSWIWCSAIMLLHYLHYTTTLIHCKYRYRETIHCN